MDELMTAEIILRCAGKAILQGAVEELVMGVGLGTRIRETALRIYEIFRVYFLIMYSNIRSS